LRPAQKLDKNFFFSAMSIAESSNEPGYGEEANTSPMHSSYQINTANLGHTQSFHRQSRGGQPYPQQRTQL